ncbi:22567_t:CDS:2, partial [Racocetra persica]
MALLAHELPEENKYASFPCNLPWMERSQIDFSADPTQPLGVKEIIFLDEINLLFKGNEFQKARERERFMSHFYALSRHQVSLLQKSDEGIYVQ